MNSGRACEGTLTQPHLSERDCKILELERNWWKYAGAKEHSVQKKFGLSLTHYYQIVNTLIDSEAALAYDPMLVKRLRRLRVSRQRDRAQRRQHHQAQSPS